MILQRKNNLSKNEIRIIKAISSLDIATRNSIAGLSRLSLFLVNSAIESLLKKELILNKESLISRGRPSNIYILHPDIGYSIGLSIDYESVRILTINSSKKIIHENNYAINLLFEHNKDPNEFLEEVIRLLEDHIKANYIERNSLFSIGIGLPGMVDMENGIWLKGIRIPGINNINIVQIIENKINIPIIIEDVAKTITYFEKCNGLGKGIRDFILLHLGSGFGTGIVINHNIYRGYHGLAGEVGHIVVDPKGYRCGCGKVGCLETVVSIQGILRRINDRIKELVISTSQVSYYQGKESLTLNDVLEAAKDGDRFTQSILFEIGSFLGDTCEQLIILFNPQKIIISGYSSVLSKYIKSSIDQTIKKKVIPEMLENFKLEFSEYSLNHEAYGAALLAIDNYWDVIIK